MDRLEDAGPQLRRRSTASIADSVARAWALIADPERAPGRAARELLPESTGLSLPMVAWALSTTFERAGAPEIERAAHHFEAIERAAPGRLSVLVLAGNVFTACVQPITMMLLARSPILIKASSRDDVLPRLFHGALAEVDPELADACAVITFPGGTSALESTLFARADIVSAYGSDATLAAIRARVPASSTFIPHGNGVGVGYAKVEALADDESAMAAAAAFALDVSAYDQRGCLSPHAIYVERGGDGRRFAEYLSNALGACATRFPRGRLDPETAGAQLQWRGVAATRGGLIERDGWAVSYEADASFRVSPGWRNVLVLDAANEAELAESLVFLGHHLKVVGVAGDRAPLAAALVAPLAPRIVPAGSMQTPSLLALADGRPPWEGLVRAIEIS
jgi:hypothetical protein